MTTPGGVVLDEAKVRAAINEIIDPCSAARGVPIGLDDLGLVQQVQVSIEAPRFVTTDVVLRLTAPGCLFFIDFENRVRQALTEAGVDCVRISWDTAFDWTPEAMAPSARRRLAEQRVALLSRTGGGPH